MCAEKSAISVVGMLCALYLHLDELPPPSSEVGTALSASSSSMTSLIEEGLERG